MLDIYICDDEEGVRSEIEGIIRNEILIQDYDMHIALSVSDPHELLEKAEKSGRSNIYFLDVELKGRGMDGFEVGKRIRAFDPQGTIIYITAFGSLAYRTFEYHIGAMDYIVKDNRQKMQAAIRSCLEEVLKRLKTRQGRGEAEYFTIRFMDRIRHIPLEEIYYFETSPRPHQVFLYARQEQLEFPGRIAEIEKSLGKRFFRVHRAYLVNLGMVREVDLKGNSLTMKNGSVCMVARSRKARLCEILTNKGMAG